MGDYLSNSSGENKRKTGWGKARSLFNPATRAVIFGF
jgi:hypothetical protein